MRGKTNHTRWLLCLLFILGAARTAAAGRVIYVDACAAEGNDGSSWKEAFNYLQDALITASAGDEIRVAEGTYRPNQGLLPLPGRERGPRTPGEEGRSATFELKSGVTVKGGFAGFGAAEPNERDTEAYQTILSGDLNGDDADVSNPPDFFYEPTRADNSVNVIISIADDASTVLDGFVVTGGVDGGMVIIDGSPTILNCVFRHNSASGGGAINIWPGQSLLRNCKFISNLAGTGGAICGVDANLTLSECSFTGNRALSIGGGALIHGNAVLAGCVFSDNTSQSGGGISHTGGDLGLGKIELIDCAFLGNSAISSSNNWYGSGGAVNTSEATANNCIFSGNWADDGGAIYGDAQSIENCIFTGNTAERGGALRLHGMQGSTIRNSVFAGNRAEEGGVLYSWGLDLSLMYCTLSDNSAQNGNAINWGPGGRRPAPVSMTISNCILWDGGGEIGTWREELADLSIVYSDIQGGCPGEGNIDLDPCFAEPGYWEPNGTPADANDDVWVDGDYHLKSQVGRWDPVSRSWVHDDVTSPCIDAGDPNTPVASEPFPNGGIINMGAYGGTAETSKSCFGERVGENNINGDINSDCKVDLVDLLTVIAQWTNGVPPILEERPLLVVDQPLDGARLEISLDPILIRAGVYDPDNSIKNVSIHVYGDGASWNTRRGAIQKEPSIWPVEYFEWEWDYNGQNQMGPEQYTIIVEAIDDKNDTIISPEIMVTLLEQPESMVAE